MFPVLISDDLISGKCDQFIFEAAIDPELSDSDLWMDLVEENIKILVETLNKSFSHFTPGFFLRFESFQHNGDNLRVSLASRELKRSHLVCLANGLVRIANAVDNEEVTRFLTELTLTTKLDAQELRPLDRTEMFPGVAFAERQVVCFGEPQDLDKIDINLAQSQNLYCIVDQSRVPDPEKLEKLCFRFSSLIDSFCFVGPAFDQLEVDDNIVSPLELESNNGHIVVGVNRIVGDANLIVGFHELILKPQSLSDATIFIDRKYQLTQAHLPQPIVNSQSQQILE